MKKFMFAAIALVAFSGVSFANSGKDAQIKTIKSLITVTEEEDLTLDKCVSVGFAASDAVYANGGTPQQATAAAEAAYNQCKKVTTGISPTH